MTGAGANDVLTSFVINASTALGFVLGFALLKNQPVHSRVYFPRWYMKGQDERIDEFIDLGKDKVKAARYINLNIKSYGHMMDWVWNTLRMTEAELLELVGLDSTVLLRVFWLGYHTHLLFVRGGGGGETEREEVIYLSLALIFIPRAVGYDEKWVCILMQCFIPSLPLRYFPTDFLQTNPTNLFFLLCRLKIFVPMMFWGCVVLVPVNKTDNQLATFQISHSGDNFTFTPIDTLSIANVTDLSKRYCSYISTLRFLEIGK